MNQHINATQLIPREDMESMVDEAFYDKIKDRDINGWTN